MELELGSDAASLNNLLTFLTCSFGGGTGGCRVFTSSSGAGPVPVGRQAGSAVDIGGSRQGLRGCASLILRAPVVCCLGARSFLPPPSPTRHSPLLQTWMHHWL